MSNYYKEPPPPYSSEYPAVHHYGPQPTAVHPPGSPPAAAYSPNQGLPEYGATQTTEIQGNPVYIVIGACPACQVGFLETDFTCLGILCAIFFFPLGILCCLALREKRCSNCGATFN